MQPLSAQSTGTPASPTQPAGSAIRVPPLSPEKINEYAALFEKSGAEGGILSGVTAKQIFERARLPNEVLGRIWNLADTKERGVLDTTEFVIAMHLLASFKSGAMRSVPQTLPPGLYEAASRKGITRTSTGSRPSSAVPSQTTGLAQNRTQSPLARQQFGTPLSAQSTGDGWLVSPADKSTFDSVFLSVDRANRGFITGDQAVEFFSNSRLPEETLAQIWDLADINSEGQLNKDEFAVAMFLIRQQRGRQDGSYSLPSALPQALIPPSMRRKQIPPSQTTAPAFDNAANISKPRSAAEDLFGLDTMTNSPLPPASAQERQITGSSTEQFQRTTSPTIPAASQTRATSFKPFVPSSSFGQSIAPQPTGLSTVPTPPVRTLPSPTNNTSDDLLGDADPEVSQKLTQETSELANLSNQVGTLSKQMQEVQSSRASTERELSQNSQQKRDFEVRLSQLRSMYEKEVKDVKSLEERLATSRTETRRLQQDLAMVDGTFQDLKNQHAKAAAALETDQRENSDLKEKIRRVNAEVASLKPQLEKLKSEARQQKGLVAINKKQLSTNESERVRLQGDLEATTKEAQDREKFTAMSPSPSAKIASPSASITSQNTNPFFRRTTTSASDLGAISPAASRQPLNDPHAAFDSVFGPSATRSLETPTPTPKDENATLPKKTSSESKSELPVPSKSLSSSQLNDTSVPSKPLTSPPSSITESGSARSTGVDETLNAVNEPAQSDKSPLQSPPEQPTAPPADVSEVTPTHLDSNEDVVDRQDGPSTTLRDIPGAFPGFDTPGTDTPGSVPKTGRPIDESGKGAFDDLFRGPAHVRSPEGSATDFDQAFAAFGTTKVETNGEPAVSSSEFPPIQEFDGSESDESSDSHVGFDDNFAPASPKVLAEEDKAAAQYFAERQEPKHEVSGMRPSLPSVTSTSGNPPQIEAQVSPPPYDKSVSHDDESRFPPEFNGLLPSRQDPTSPSEPSHSISRNIQPTADVAKSFTPSSTNQHKNAQDSSTGDDFDAVFANLGVAPSKEADHEEDTDELNGSSTSIHNDEARFDPTFDSNTPFQPSVSAPETQKSKRDVTTKSDFNDFESSLSAPQSLPLSTLRSSNNLSHDWDAIFAGLDAPAPSSVTNLSAEQISATSPPVATETKDVSSRPTPGRALSSGTEHDDPFLKRLTGMGWNRDESLRALEKYDYNLDKVCAKNTSLDLHC